MKLKNINKIKFNFGYYNFILKFRVVIIKNTLYAYYDLKLKMGIKNLPFY